MEEKIENFCEIGDTTGNFSQNSSKLVENYKKGERVLRDILEFNINPSTKITLLAMVIHKSDAYTVPELNVILNKRQTLENYQHILSSFIEKKIVIETSKRYGGKLRKAFSISYSDLLDYEDDNITEE